MQEHAKGIAGLATAITGSMVAWWPFVETMIRDASGIAALVSGIYTALYFRKLWKKS